MSTARGEPGGRRVAKESLRALASPMLAYFDKRFQEAYDRIDDRMNELYSRVATEVETMSEMTIVMQRFLDLAGAQVEDAVAGIKEARASAAGDGPSDAELVFAVAAVGRMRSGARILHVGTDRGLPATLRAIGYDVSTLDLSGGLDGDRFDGALWLSAEPDRHTVELLGKSLNAGGELVMSVVRSAGFVDEGLWDWTVVERRRLSRTDAGWQAAEGTSSGPVLELVRATPRT